MTQLSSRKPEIIAIAPNMPCEDCLQAHATIRQDGNVRIYCQHNQAMALFDGDIWTVWSPVTPPFQGRVSQNSCPLKAWTGE